MVRQSGDSDMRQLLKVLTRNLEEHWAYPLGVLTSGAVKPLATGYHRAVWTDFGGAVDCDNPLLVTRLIDAIQQTNGDNSARILTSMAELLPSTACQLNLLLYCAQPIISSPRIDDIQLTSSPEEAPDVNLPPGVQYLSLLRDNGQVIAHAYSLPQLDSHGYRFAAIGVKVHADHRRQGLGMAVVCRLLQQLATMRQLALWSCDVENTASLHLAEKVGFRVGVRILTWE